MSLDKKDIHIGSGYVYVMPYSGTIPSDSVIEKTSQLLGYVKDGATITYTPSYKDINNINRENTDTFITDEKVVIRVGVMTWNADTLARVTQTGNVTTSGTTKTFALGGLNNSDMSKVIVRFVHIDGKHRVTIVGISRSGFEITNQKGKEAVVSAEFTASPMTDGRLLIYEETDTTTPASTITIIRNGSYNIEAYTTAIVQVPVWSSGTAQEGHVLEGYTFSNSVNTGLEGSMPDLSGQKLEAIEEEVDPDTGEYLVSGGSGYYDEDTRVILPNLGNAPNSVVLEGYIFSSSELEEDSQYIGKEGSMPDFSDQIAEGLGLVDSGENLVILSPATSGYYDSVSSAIGVSASDIEGIGNASTSDVVSGKSFTSSNGAGIVGTLKEISRATEATADTEASIELSATDTASVYEIDSIDIEGSAKTRGYVDKDRYVCAYINGMDARPGDVAAGKTFIGYYGAKEVGTASTVFSTVKTIGSSETTGFTVSHSLGRVPTNVIIRTNSLYDTYSEDNYVVCEISALSSDSEEESVVTYFDKDNGAYATDFTYASDIISTTSSTIVFDASALASGGLGIDAIFLEGIAYTIIAW